MQGLPGCEYRRPTAITERPCWWGAGCPLRADGSACLADISVDAVLSAYEDLAIMAACERVIRHE